MTNTLLPKAHRGFHDVLCRVVASSISFLFFVVVTTPFSVAVRGVYSIVRVLPGQTPNVISFSLSRYLQLAYRRDLLTTGISRERRVWKTGDGIVPYAPRNNVESDNHYRARGERGSMLLSVSCALLPCRMHSSHLRPVECDGCLLMSNGGRNI